MANVPLTALIVDDEPLARQELKYLLDRAGDVSVVAQGANGIEAVDLIRTHRPDVVFLDVRMPGLDGFAVLRKLLSTEFKGPLPQVVFATAFDQYAVKAFEVNAIDYLLKPFDGQRLAKTLDKVRSRARGDDEQAAFVPRLAQVAPAAKSSRAQEPASPPSAVPHLSPVPEPGNQRLRIWEVAQAKLDTLLRMVEEQTAGGSVGSQSISGQARTGKVVLRLGERLLLVDQADVCFASIEEGRISVVTKTLEGDSTARTLEDLADQLDPAHFWRAHRSYLVNLQHIREVMPWFKSTYKLRMDDRHGTEIPVSRSQTRRLRELFNL